MKIVHLMYWYIQNMGYQENFLPAEQSKLGNEVYIITSNLLPVYGNINDNFRKLIPSIFTENGVEIHSLPTIIKIQKSSQLLLKGIKRKLREIQPDIVHSHGTFSSVTIYAIHYQKKFKYNLFIDDHSHKGNFRIDTIYKKIYIFLVKNYIKQKRNRINCFFPVQYSSKKILEHYFPNLNKKLLHLGANDNLFFPSNELREKIRNILEIAENDLLIVTSGKFNENKDITYLLDAFAELETKGAYHLLIIGNGHPSYMNKLKLNTENNNISERVIFIDFLKNQDLNKYYNAADIGVWPGDHTIGVVEAIASGLPVIVPKDDKAYEILFKYKAAIGFKRRNIQSMKSSIEILSNKNTREIIKKQGLALISNILSWKKIAKKSIEYYQYY